MHKQTHSFRFDSTRHRINMSVCGPTFSIFIKVKHTGLFIKKCNNRSIDEYRRFFFIFVCCFYENDAVVFWPQPILWHDIRAHENKADCDDWFDFFRWLEKKGEIRTDLSITWIECWPTRINNKAISWLKKNYYDDIYQINMYGAFHVNMNNIFPVICTDETAYYISFPFIPEHAHTFSLSLSALWYHNGLRQSSNQCYSIYTSLLSLTPLQSFECRFGIHIHDNNDIWLTYEYMMMKFYINN